MSSVDFVEVARKGNQPVVAMGHVNVREVVAKQPDRDATLRVFALNSHGHHFVPFSLVSLSLLLVHHVARLDSEVRDQLKHRWKSPAHDRLLFRTSGADFGHVERLEVTSWLDLEPIAQSNLNRCLWLAVEGDHGDVLKLLDSIREQDAGDCAAPAPVQSPPLATSASHEAAIEFRNELLAKNWPDGKRVAKMAGSRSGSNPHQYAARLRSGGGLLGVWVATERTYRHPDFQFDSHGGVRPEVSDLLKVLPSDEEDRGGWRRAFWLYSPHAKLDGETPAEVFVRDPKRVVEVAEGEFRGDADAHW